jgi:hypothetical protein
MILPERQRILDLLAQKIRETIAAIETAQENHETQRADALGGKLVGLTLARAIVREETRTVEQSKF